MFDITKYITGKQKRNASGWTNFNAPCCQHRGETPDRRMRGGIIATDTGWSYHCFNCNFKANYSSGRALSFNVRRLLTWMGVSENEIQRLSLENLRNRDVGQILADRNNTKTNVVHFEPVPLPEHARLVTNTDTEIVEYLHSRSIDFATYPYMVDPTQSRLGVLVPHTYKDQIVGYTTRFLDDRRPKYLNSHQLGYVFGTELLMSSWKYAFVVEGVFDALSIGAIAVMHNDISQSQAAMLEHIDKEIVVVPDHDRAGLQLIDRAVELGYGVSIPNWDTGIKDVNDAVKRYGQLATAISILNSYNTSKIKIELARRTIERKIK